MKGGNSVHSGVKEEEKQDATNSSETSTESWSQPVAGKGKVSAGER